MTVKGTAAAVVGFIALAGVAVEIGVIVLLYLNQAFAQAVAAPMVGGMVGATVLTLIVIPAVFPPWKRATLARQVAATEPVTIRTTARDAAR